MSVEKTIAGQPKSEPAPTGRRRERVKAGVFALVMLALLIAGLRGRQDARVVGKVDQMMAVRDELQQKLDEPDTPSGQVKAFAGALRERLRQFDGEHDPKELSAVNSLRTRVCRGTLANAEQRFGDALLTITDEDEKAHPNDIRVLQVRADALYGHREWGKALELYQRMAALQPKRKATLARVTACQKALGKNP